MHQAEFLLIVLIAFCGCLGDETKKDQDVLSAMRNALRKMTPEDVAETARSMKKKHEESKTVMPSLIPGHDKVCWEKCKPGEKSTMSIFLKDVEDEDNVGNKRRSMSEEDVKMSDNNRNGKSNMKKKIKKTTVKYIFSPGNSGGWSFSGRIVPIKDSDSLNNTMSIEH